MCQFTVPVLLFAAAILAGTQAHFPEYIKKCSESDPEFQKCIVRNGNVAIEIIGLGVPELDIPVIHKEFQLGTVQMKLADGLQLSLTDAESENWSIRLTEATRVQLKKSHVFFAFISDRMIIDAHFNISGRREGRSVEETGKTQIVLERVSYNWTSHMKTRKGADGNVHFYASRPSGRFSAEEYSYTTAMVDTVTGKDGSLFGENWHTIKRKLPAKLNVICTEVVTDVLDKFMALESAEDIFLP